jgi:hypothetical protein
MMAKTVSVSAISGSGRTSSSLERLYARRLALDNVIESLEDYQRYRSMRLEPPQRADERQRRSA